MTSKWAPTSLSRLLARKSRDHSLWERLPEYRTAMWAIDDLIKAIDKNMPQCAEDEDENFSSNEAYLLAAELCFILPYLDCCYACGTACYKAGHDVHYSMKEGCHAAHPPYQTEINGDWMTGRYRCAAGHHWQCGWRLPELPWSSKKPFASPRPQSGEKIESCYLCLEPLELGDIELDHVLPKSRGGTDSALMPVHRECNRAKGNRPLIQRPR